MKWIMSNDVPNFEFYVKLLAQKWETKTLQNLKTLNLSSFIMWKGHIYRMVMK